MKGQIPNAGFENWTSYGMYENPDQWASLNGTLVSSSAFTCLKGSPGSTGNYYIHLISKTVGSTVVPGMAVSGTMDTITRKPLKGFPFSSRPVYLSGDWQYMPNGHDNPKIEVLLSKWNTLQNKRDTIAYTLNAPLGMYMAWGSFNMTVNYVSSAAPDSALIVLSSSASSPVFSSYLNIDNLSFSDTPRGIKEKYKTYGIQLGPDPAGDELALKALRTENPVERVSICNLAGQEVLTRQNNTLRLFMYISLTQLPPGVYLIRIQTKEGIQQEKFIHQ
ncbi:MAG: T9SS type A sorting domain-containing protein [Bacteroidia bacterium]